ncbi:cell wall hydrolase [Azospirillum sp. RWY-5-1]|uniref:Cell wall hydrolase n=1 Tax=Azospirillum oleiclasticum TaxID=2735135 RepID=A0ABX2T879_9PROT|nr:cell wall hydrolase [Azospirillum oleiclasticum]NYZ12845.1 cell wall hydrolase [Azospirillum oleiclasticum]NYZ20005.1 cell wall hydrolase [Azospirillum oleiclasticum]
MRLLVLALALAAAGLPGTADAGSSACRPGDGACIAFAEGKAGKLPKRGGERQPVMIGAAVHMLTPWQAERERRCLAIAGWAEARGDGPEAMAAVMWVLANRASSDAHPETPCKALVAAAQFEPFTQKARKVPKPARKPGSTGRANAAADTDPTAEARRIAADLRRQARVIAAGGMPSWPRARLAPDRTMLDTARAIAWNLNDDDLPDPTRRALLFYSPPVQARLGRATPAWAEPAARTVSIGDHTFFRDRPVFRPAAPQVAEAPE